MFTVVYDYLSAPTTRVLRSLFLRCVCVYACRCVCLHDEITLDRNELKLRTVVVVESLSKPINFGFKMLGLLPANQNYAVIRPVSHNIIHCGKTHPTYIMCIRI